MRLLADPLRFVKRRVPFSAVLAVMYIVTAISIISGPNRTIQYMADVGLHGDAYVIILAACAAILMGKPSNAWYIVAVTPLALYSAFSIFTSISSGMGNAGVTLMYASAITALPLAYRLCSAKGLRIHKLYGALFLPMAVAILASPPLGTVAWIQENYGVLSWTVASTLGIGAALVLLTVSRRVFFMFLVLLMGYSTSAIMLSINTNSPVGVSVNSIVFITLVYTMIKLDKYFPASEITDDDA